MTHIFAHFSTNVDEELLQLANTLSINILTLPLTTVSRIRCIHYPRVFILRECLVFCIVQKLFSWSVTLTCHGVK